MNIHSGRLSMEDTTFPRHRGSLIAGLILLAIGIAFLLDNFDLVYIGEPISHFWPMIIVALGLVRIFEAENTWERRRGFVWLFFGLWLLASVLHMFGLTFHTSWPLLLIGFGVNAIWKAVSTQPEGRLSKE
jgi:hypothetical protein